MNPSCFHQQFLILKIAATMEEFTVFVDLGGVGCSITRQWPVNRRRQAT